MRTSLYSKIIPWFFISLAISATLLFLLFRVDFRIRPGMPFQDPGGEPLVNLAWRISSELSREPEANREAILARYADEQQMEFYFFDRKGYQILGPAVQLPPEVENILMKTDHPKPHPHNRHSGRDLHSAWRDTAPPPPSKPPPPEHDSHRFMVKAGDPARYWAGVRLPFKPGFGPPEPVVLLAVSDSRTGHGLFWDPAPWILAIGLFILLGVFLWIPIIRNITSPIRRMTRITEEMAKGHFNVKLDEKRSDEIGRLGVSINDMARHLNSYLSNQRRFLADISHELTSPIAKAKLALSIVEPNIEGKPRIRIRNALTELENMSSLVEKLLALTRTEIGSSTINLIQVNVKEVIARAVEQEKDGVASISIDVDDSLVALADADLLFRAFVNLVRNAVRYAGNDGPINIKAWKINDSLFIEISDHGSGVPDLKLDYIFEPFYRAEESRCRKTGGVGLGLAIVKSCVEACNGTVSASNLKPNGFMVRVELRPSVST